MSTACQFHRKVARLVCQDMAGRRAARNTSSEPRRTAPARQSNLIDFSFRN